MSARPGLNFDGSPKSRVAAAVVAQLRDRIARGEHRPGDQLPPERELARAFKVSRPSVRRAIAFLSAVGIVDSRHGSGTFVAADPPACSRSNICAPFAGKYSRPDLREAQVALGTAVAKLAASRVTDAQLSELAEQVLGMHRTIDTRYKFSISVENFHRILRDAAGNTVLASLLEATVIENEGIRELARRVKNPSRLANLHHTLYIALRTHDCSRAAALMEQALRKLAHRSEFVSHTETVSRISWSSEAAAPNQVCA